MDTPLRIFVNVGGTLSSAEDAVISALDHGFLFGDSVYETVRTFDRVPFLLEEHLDRLGRSMDRLFLSWPVPRDELRSEVLRTIEASPFDTEVRVRIVVSRGVGPFGLDIDKCRDPLFVIYLSELAEGAIPASASADGPDDGLPVVFSSVTRNSPDALDPSIKSGNFLNNILAFRDAKAAGAHEAILCRADGTIAEGTTSNVFMVKDGVLATPRCEGILEGITRAVILAEARDDGIPVEEREIAPEEFLNADEAFISSSVRGIVPISQVGETSIADGRRGPITRRLQALYQKRVDESCGRR
ncbi:MAG: aminotransferase class IV [Planctomycetota bacterium]